MVKKVRRDTNDLQRKKVFYDRLLMLSLIWLTSISVLHLTISILYTFRTSLSSFGVISIWGKLFTQHFICIVSKSPDKEYKESHKNDLKEDDGQDVTAGPEGLYFSARHAVSTSSEIHTLYNNSISLIL